MKVAITFPSHPTIKQPMLLDRQIGQGKFKVYLAKSLESNTQYALKVFSKDFALRQFFSREASCISKLEHPHIIKHYPILSHNFRLDIMLTEYTPNGDLFDFITKGYLNDEKMIRTYFHQLIDGLEYMHSNGIAHLDLKLENLLLDENFVLKIIDFDQSQQVTDEKMISLGTNGYRPPEVINRTCRDFVPVDVYAAGVILFAARAREFPFDEIEDKEEVKVKDYDTFMERNEDFWREKGAKHENEGYFSKEFRDLINGMLNENAVERFSIEDVKKSEWYNGAVYTREELKDEVTKVIGAATGEPQK